MYTLAAVGVEFCELPVSIRHSQIFICKANWPFIENKFTPILLFKSYRLSWANI